MVSYSVSSADFFVSHIRARHFKSPTIDILQATPQLTHGSRLASQLLVQTGAVCTYVVIVCALCVVVKNYQTQKSCHGEDQSQAGQAHEHDGA